jgi:hypothetical protein
VIIDTVQAVRENAVHKLMCIVVSAVMTTFCMVIRRVYLHDVFMIVIGVEGAHQEEEPSHHNVAPKMSLPYEPSHTPSAAVSTKADASEQSMLCMIPE